MNKIALSEEAVGRIVAVALPTALGGVAGIEAYRNSKKGKKISNAVGAALGGALVGSLSAIPLTAAAKMLVRKHNTGSFVSAFADTVHDESSAGGIGFGKKKWLEPRYDFAMRKFKETGTKLDAKRRYRDIAFKHHPNANRGSKIHAQHYNDISRAWKDFKSSEGFSKLSYLQKVAASAMMDELEIIKTA